MCVWGGVVCVFECFIFYLSQNTSQNHPLSGRKRNTSHWRINDVSGVEATHSHTSHSGAHSHRLGQRSLGAVPVLQTEILNLWEILCLLQITRFTHNNTQTPHSQKRFCIKLSSNIKYNDFLSVVITHISLSFHSIICVCVFRWNLGLQNLTVRL